MNLQNLVEGHLPTRLLRAVVRSPGSASVVVTNAAYRLPVKAAYHGRQHVAPATAELCRPFPLGSIRVGPPAPPQLAGASYSHTVKVLEASFWTTDRLRPAAKATTDSLGFGQAVIATASAPLLQRLARVQNFCSDSATLRTDTPMLLFDLLFGYYFRRLQLEVALHVCKMGY